MKLTDTSKDSLIESGRIKEKTEAITHRQKRNFGLDVLRCMAIMLVLISHGEYLFYDHVPAILGNNLVFTGHWGVQLFFVLSGFLIGNILIRDMLNQGLRRAVIFNFWKRRWFRTLPNYYLFLVLYIILGVVTPASFLAVRFWGRNFMIEQWSLLAYFPLFLQNFKTTDIGFFGHSWSLSVEEWFYLSTPCILFVIFYISRKTLIRRTLLCSLVGLIVFFIGLRIAGLCGWLPDYNKLSVIYNLDNLIFGVLVAWLFCFNRNAILRRKVILLCCSVFLFLTGLVLQNLFILTGNPNHVWDGLIVPLQAFAFACAVPWFHEYKVGKDTWWKRLITEISLDSYSMYLVHLIVLTYFIDTLHIHFGGGSPSARFLLFGLFIFVTIALSAVNFRLYERPMTALRERFSKS